MLGVTQSVQHVRQSIGALRGSIERRDEVRTGHGFASLFDRLQMTDDD
jgi:hypothetical protein